jgi:hypothetical protein
MSTVITPKFEFNTARLFTQREDESKAAMIAKAALGFIPALLSDVVRIVLFKANLIDGKSFNAVEKVKATWEAYQNPSFEIRVERSKANLKAKAKALVNAYIALDRNFLGMTRDSFGSLGQQAIQKAQNELLAAMKADLVLNAKYETFNVESKALEEFIQDLIMEAAGNEVFFGNKTLRQHLPLSSLILSEFKERLQETQGERFATVLGAESSLTKLQQLTPEAQVQAFEVHLVSMFKKILKLEGMIAAEEAIGKEADEAFSRKLITEKQRDTALFKAVQSATLDEQAKGIAIDIVRKIANPEHKDDPKELALIVEEATHLIEDERLNKEAKSSFCFKVREEIAAIRGKKMRIEKAYKELNAFAKENLLTREMEAKFAEEAEILNAKRQDLAKVVAKADKARLEAQEFSQEKTDAFNRLNNLLQALGQTNMTADTIKAVDEVIEANRPAPALAPIAPPTRLEKLRSWLDVHAAARFI